MTDWLYLYLCGAAGAAIVNGLDMGREAARSADGSVSEAKRTQWILSATLWPVSGVMGLASLLGMVLEDRKREAKERREREWLGLQEQQRRASRAAPKAKL